MNAFGNVRNQDKSPARQRGWSRSSQGAASLPQMDALEQRGLLSVAPYVVPTTVLNGIEVDSSPARLIQSAHQKIDTTAVTISLSVRQARVEEGDPILVTLTVTNRSRKPIFFSMHGTPFFPGVGFLDVHSAAGYALRNGPNIDSLWSNHPKGYLKIPARRAASMTFDLNEYYFSNPIGSHLPMRMGVGTWTIQYTGEHRYTARPLNKIKDYGELESALLTTNKLTIKIAPRP